jgi:hypothetical protein
VPAIGEDATQGNGVVFEEGQHAIVQQVGRGDRGLLGAQLGEADLGVGLDERVLVNAPTPFRVPTSKVSCAPQYPGHALYNSP